MRSLVNQFPPLLPFLVLWFEPFYFSFTLILSPSLAFYQSLSSVSQRSLPSTASFSVICVYGCDSAQNKKQAECMLGCWSSHLFIRHKRHTHYTLIERAFVFLCVWVRNCRVVANSWKFKTQLQKLKESDICLFRNLHWVTHVCMQMCKCSVLMCIN